MKARKVWLTAVFFIAFMGFGLSHAQDEVENILDNGGFEDGVIEPWITYGNATFEVVTDDPIEGDYCVQADVHEAGANFWDVWLKHIGLVFEQGKHYTFSAFLKCDTGERQIMLKPELDADPWTGYGAQTFTMTDEWQEYSVTTPVFTGNVDPADVVFLMAYAAGTIWIDGVRFYEGDYVPPVLRKKVAASSPSPEDGVDDVPRDTALSWVPSPFAATHNVYFGTVYDDVNNADATNTLDVLVSQEQDANTFDPAGLLDFSQTYYWRVDEVNNLNPESPWKGDVWSFTAEPFVYPIENITATASSSHSGDMRPERTIDGSGLNDSDQHSTEITGMWLSDISGQQPTWIQYEFDSVYKLHEMWVWNFNYEFEYNFGYGLKDVTVEYSTNGTDWTQLDGMPEFAQGPGTGGYAHNPPIDLGGIVAKYVKITANSNWGSQSQYGLSEVRFFYMPVKAWQPKPASGETGVSLDTVLSWRAGREAATNEIYFSSDMEAVVNGTAILDTITENNYEISSLEYGKTYYWKVNEVNDSESPMFWEGDVWSFSTLEYSVVDDFEQYNDVDNKIFDVWGDYFVNNTGMTVGHFEPPFAEQNIVHEGSQSMPLRYDNDGAVNEGTAYERVGTMCYSEAEREWMVPQDWTIGGVGMLTLFFRGNPQAFVESSPGNIVMSGTGADIYQMTDEFRYAYKRLDGDGSITARIDSIQDTHEWAKVGLMIRSHLEPRCMQVHMVGSPRNRIEWMYRPAAGVTTTGTSTAVNSTPLPHWVRLTRQGNTFIGEHSADGVNWVNITDNPASSSVQLQMPATVYIGLVVTSHVSGVLCKAEFSEVSTTGNVTGPWQLADVGVTQGGNEAEPLYVAVEDNAGNIKVVDHPDNPNAVLVNNWQQWNIPFSDFSDAGIDLTAIKKMYIGVGNRAAPVIGGTGTLYIDDIRLY